MTARTLSGIALAVCGVLLLCSGLIGVVSGGTAGAAACPIPAPSASASTTTPIKTPAAGQGPVGRWNAEQTGNAAAIIAAGALRQVPPRGWVIALATAMQESTLNNLPGGDRDSVGLFQQRPSQGWGTPEQLQDPVYATNAFYDVLVQVDGYADLPITEVAQRVQRSAFPSAYADHEPEGRAYASALTGYSPASLTCRLRPVTDVTAQAVGEDGLWPRAAEVVTRLEVERGEVPYAAADRGTAAQLQDPAYAAGKFYDALLRVAGWQTMPLTEAAQAVQRSAYPDAYAQWEPDATALVHALTGTCAVAVSAQGWMQPLRGPVGSGFRTADPART